MPNTNQYQYQLQNDFGSSGFRHAHKGRGRVSVREGDGTVKIVYNEKLFLLSFSLPNATDCN